MQPIKASAFLNGISSYVSDIITLTEDYYCDQLDDTSFLSKAKVHPALALKYDHITRRLPDILFEDCVKKEPWMALGYAEYRMTPYQKSWGKKMCSSLAIKVH
jgi:hypothetical protein